MEYRWVDNNVIFPQDLLGLPLCRRDVTRRKEWGLVWDIFGPPGPAFAKEALFEATRVQIHRLPIVGTVPTRFAHDCGETQQV